jgi:Spy/CpxP family protein refolding chaperone
MKIRPWLAMALIFVAGMIAGAALTFGFRPAWHPPGPQQMQRHWISHLTERLNLTADQQGKIQGILADAGEQIRRNHREEVDKISQVMAQADAQIYPLLDDNQKAEFKKMQDERQRDFSHHMGPWGGPGGPDFHGGRPPGGPGLGGRPNMEGEPENGARTP